MKVKVSCSKLECRKDNIFKDQPGSVAQPRSVAKNATLRPPAGN